MGEMGAGREVLWRCPFQGICQTAPTGKWHSSLSDLERKKLPFGLIENESVFSA